MSKYAFTTTQLTAIEQMKRLGFTHGKIELEAELHRPYDDYGNDSCYNCNEGYVNCDSCYGLGVLDPEEGEDEGRECDDCDGDGNYLCGTCDGDWEGSSDGSWDDDTCEEWLHDHVSPEARAAIVFSRFYDDGSVDSEFTFTMKLDDLPLAVEYLDAFKAMADEMGSHIETSGAGMHLTVLTSGQYPARTSLNRRKLANFTNEVSKLLPALYFLASPDYASRGLSYRRPRISSDKHGDYPAICTHNGTCLEYRIFETCYQRPLALLEDFEVIANTLKYYSTRKLAKVKAPEFSMETSGQGLERFYRTTERLETLNNTLPYVKPKDKTVTELKKERNFKLTFAKLDINSKINRLRFKKMYEEYVAQIERNNRQRLERYIAEREGLRNLIRRNPLDINYMDSTQRFMVTDAADSDEAIDAHLRANDRYTRIQDFDTWLSRQRSNGALLFDGPVSSPTGRYIV